MDYQDLGCRIGKRRRQLNLTQEKLAERVGISASFMGHIERGARTLSVNTLVALCRVLQISPNELLRGSLLRWPTDLSAPEKRAVLALIRLAEEVVVENVTKPHHLLAP